MAMPKKRKTARSIHRPGVPTSDDALEMLMLPDVPRGHPDYTETEIEALREDLLSKPGGAVIWEKWKKAHEASVKKRASEPPLPVLTDPEALAILQHPEGSWSDDQRVVFRKWLLARPDGARLWADWLQGRVLAQKEKNEDA